MRFSKVISYGNAADLSEIDFLEYFAADQETKIIAAYIEGVKDGQRFIQALRNAAPESVKAILEKQKVLVEAGIPVYPGIRRAAHAISTVVQYQRSRL